MLFFVIFVYMTTLEYKQEVMKWLESGDEQLARLVYIFIKTYKDENPVVGSVGGTRIRQSDLEQQILASERDFTEGRYSSADELKEEAKSW